MFMETIKYIAYERSGDRALFALKGSETEMKIRKIYGKYPEMVIAYKNMVFAKTDRFTAWLEPGEEKARIRLDDVIVTNKEMAARIIRDIQNGAPGVFGFIGCLTRIDKYREKIDFRDCSLAEDIVLWELAGGELWEMNLTANGVTEKQIEQFHKQGR